MIDNRMKYAFLISLERRRSPAHSHRIERQLDLAREEIYAQRTALHGAAAMTRDSSFDLLVTGPAVTTEAAALPLEAAEDDSSSTDDEGDRHTLVDSTSLSAPSTPAKRRKEILARLGLKPGQGYSGTTSADASSAQEDSDDGAQRRGVRGARGVRRGFSMGNLRARANADATSESEDDRTLGPGVGWDSAGSGS